MYFAGRDPILERSSARELLRSVGVTALVPHVRVEWNSTPPHSRRTARVSSANSFRSTRVCASAAKLKLIARCAMNWLISWPIRAPVDAGFRRTDRSGARLVATAGITPRTSGMLPLTLPLSHAATVTRAGVFLYRCPKCAADFPRVRQIRRAVACLACCRRYNRGAYDQQYNLRLVRSEQRA